MAAALSASGLGKRYGRRWALDRLHLDDPRRPRGRPGRAERRRQVDAAPPGGRPAARRAPGDRGARRAAPPTTRRSWAGWVRGPGHPDLRRAHAWTTTWRWVRTRTRTGTRRWPASASRSSISTRSSGPASSRAASGPSSPSPWPWPSGPSSCLDEPVASLDPLARREFLQVLMEAVAEHDVSVVLSSHLVADLERVCDYLVVLVSSRVQVAGEVDDLLASHRRLVGPRRDTATCPRNITSSRRATPIARARCWCAATDPCSTRPGPSRTSASRTSSWPTWARREAAPANDPRRIRRCGDQTGRGPMIVFSWRQFRSQALIGAAGLVFVGVVLALTGPHLVHVYDSELAACRTSNAQSRPATTRSPGIGWPPGRAQRGGPVGPGAPRHVLGRTAHRPRARNGDVPPGLDPERRPAALAAREDGTGRSGRHGGGGRPEPDVHLVVQPARQGEPEPVQPGGFGLHGFVPAGYALSPSPWAPRSAFWCGAPCRRWRSRWSASSQSAFVVAEIRPHFMSPVTTSTAPRSGGCRIRGVEPGLTADGGGEHAEPSERVGIRRLANAAGQSPTGRNHQEPVSQPRPGSRPRASSRRPRAAGGPSAVIPRSRARPNRPNRSSTSASTGCRRSTTCSSRTSRPTASGPSRRWRPRCSWSCPRSWSAGAPGGSGTGSAELPSLRDAAPMLWLTIRQFRVQALVAAVGLASSPSSWPSSAPTSP